jgi:outer membrane protein OmpA-like peptidoglycan-associated protein
MRDTTVDGINKSYQFKIDSSNYYYLNDYYFQVRAYFDDICIAPRRLDGSCNCSDTAAPEKFEAGKIYALRNIYFDLDRALLKPESQKELQHLLDILREYPEMEIQVNGHTDSINSAAYNIRLSDKRAAAVVNWLVTNGVAKHRLRWKGFGESQPITTNSTPEGRAINRRVEFLVLKVKNEK